MGCVGSSAKPLSADPKAYAADAFVIRIDRAVRVPSMDVGSESDPYVRVRSNRKTYGRTPVKVDDPNPVWEHVIDVTGMRLEADIDFDVWDRDRSNMNDRIGMSRISVRDLIKRPKTMMLVLKPGGSGDFVVRDALPMELHVSVIKVPLGWPSPQPSEFENGNLDRKKYPKHVMIITRGTRGDVQPYCALARGLANLYGWCVTICTELRYKDFILKSAEKLEKGTIRYRPSGGDTHSRIDKPIARWAMKHQSELMQLAMLARSEREFFASEPAFYFWTEVLKPDAIIYGFTMVNIAMILSERFQIPAVGFVLQPTSLPSKHYPPVASIDTHLLSYVDKIERKAANHDFLQTFKRWMEDDPIFSPLSAMRERRGLRPFKAGKSETFSLLLKQKCAPIIVPINPIAFGGRPSDWPDAVSLTDFIFLQGDVVPKLSKTIVDFIDSARASNDPVVAMTFSSMPVSRGDIVQSALRIVKECESHPRVIALSGSKVKDKLPVKLEKELQNAVKEGKILELEGAPFGLLFDKLDAVCVHGGLGTTAEAMRAGIPTTVVGVLLMDQRFWGMQCEKLGIGSQMVHIATWKRRCVQVVDDMLKADSPYRTRARELAQQIKATSPDGVPENVEAIVKAIESAIPIDTGGVKIKRSKDATSSNDDEETVRISLSSESSSVAADPAMVALMDLETPIEEQSEERQDFLKRIKSVVLGKSMRDGDEFSLRAEDEHVLMSKSSSAAHNETNVTTRDVPCDDRDEFVE